MVLQQLDEALADHSGRAENTNWNFLGHAPADSKLYQVEGSA
jgi:chitodextrinase